ncbi:MAG: hypothetical protein K0R55_4022 [Sporomusa sp.]|jgi:hypothetical protein|nr:hypothetical protein [Sporomusa sp.]
MKAQLKLKRMLGKTTIKPKDVVIYVQENLGTER